MKPATDVSIAGQGHETWLPLLQLAAEEVFEIMLGAKLEPLTGAESAPASEITAMVGLAGHLCGCDDTAVLHRHGESDCRQDAWDSSGSGQSAGLGRDRRDL